MKKLMITVLITFGMFFSTNAQEGTTLKSEVIQEKVQKEYKKIDVGQLPRAVKNAVMQDFEGAKIAEAYVGQDKTYKLVLDADGQKKTVYADANGKWIDKK